MRSPRPLRAALTAVALALTLAACGSASPSPSGHAEGRALFKTSCSGCHSLTGHQSPRYQGGDLVAAKLSRRIALQYAREMPVRHPLSETQLAAIVDYIAAVQQQR